MCAFVHLLICAFCSLTAINNCLCMFEILCLEIRGREISKSGPCSQELCRFSEKRKCSEGYKEVQVQRLKLTPAAEMEVMCVGLSKTSRRAASLRLD